MAVNTESVRLRSAAPARVSYAPEVVAQLDVRPRYMQYLVVCAVFGAVLLILWAISPVLAIGRVAYSIGLLCVCVAPFYLYRAAKERLLIFFSAWYFAVFGLHTVIAIVFGPTESTLNFLRAYSLDQVGLAKSDLVVIVGGVVAMIGYLLVQNINRRDPTIFSAEWNPGVAFWVAVVCWIVGFIFSVAYYMTVTPANIPSHLLNVPLNIASNVRLLTMLASVMLVYLAMRGYSPRLVWPALIAIILIEYVLGFAANTKEVSYRVPALLLIGSYFLHGSFNKKILLAILVTFIPYHLLFDVYRNEIILARGHTSIKAVENLENTRSLLQKYASREQNVVRDNLQALADRVNGKVYVDIIVGRTGTDVAFQNGATLANIAYTFIPRAFWPEKPDTSTGQLFNHEFGLSESSLTFVPTTFLGEFYWNYGWTGVLIGMLLVGASFGYIGKLHTAITAVTLPRFVLLLTACYYLVLRFEASIGQQYGIFGRILMLLLLLHWLLVIGRLTASVGDAVTRRWRLSPVSK